MKQQYQDYDGSEFLDSDTDIVEYLNAAWEENDAAFFMKALGNVAKAKGIADIAAETDLNRESLYKALSGNRDAKLGTLIKILSALHIQIEFKAA